VVCRNGASGTVHQRDGDACCRDGACAKTMHGPGFVVGRWPVDQLGHRPCGKHLRKIRELGLVCSVGQPATADWRMGSVNMALLSQNMLQE
jgi:hypothetical protein